MEKTNFVVENYQVYLTGYVKAVLEGTQWTDFRIVVVDSYEDVIVRMQNYKLKVEVLWAGASEFDSIVVEVTVANRDIPSEIITKAIVDKLIKKYLEDDLITYRYAPKTAPNNQQMPEHIYVYRARCENVVDGDTVDLAIDTGFQTFRESRVRLLGIDTPEMKKPTHEAGMEAKRYVEAWMREAQQSAPDQEWPLLIQTEKDSDNFGRYLAYMWRAGDKQELNQTLLDSGYAVEFRK